MSREMRRVPANWQHPQVAKFALNAEYRKLTYIPLAKHSDLLDAIKRLKEEARLGESVLYKLLDEYAYCKGVYMPDFGTEATHYMMYETCSEGTPISPAFETPEELARWLTVSRASMFGDTTGTYEQWLRIAKGDGECVGLMIEAGVASPALT